MINENKVIELETKISLENATVQVEMFKDYYEIDFHDIESDAARKNIEASVNRLKRAICKGRVEIKIEEQNGTLVVVQTLKKPVGDLTSVTYKEISGKAKIRLKDRDDDDNYGKLYALMGGLCGESDAVMQSFTGADMSAMEVLGALFLAV